MRPFLASCAALLTTAGLLAISASQTASAGQPSGSETIPERFLGLFHDASGKQVIEIQPSGKQGEVKVSIRGGMAGTTDLLGHIAQDNKLHATGESRFCTLLGGCDAFVCNLVGEVNGTNLTGTYECLHLDKPNTVVSQMEHRQYRQGPGKIDFQKFVPEHTSR